MAKQTKVLIIEDEHLLRQAFEFLLKSEGFKVKSARDGRTGQAALKKFQPDVILLDMLMPVMNGMDFLESAHVEEVVPNCKVIILSNLSDTVQLRDMKKYNVVKILLKANLGPKDLVAEVRKIK